MKPSEFPQTLKAGCHFYFPDFPDHPFNDCFAHAWSGSVGQKNGQHIHASLETFEDSKHNRSHSPGYWEGRILITGRYFNTDEPIEVWHRDEYGEIIDTCYLAPEPFEPFQEPEQR